MTVSLTSTTSSFVQLLTVALIFVFVLFLTYWVTKWIGNYQKDKFIGGNVEIIETKRIAPNKLVEIVRIGDKYFALAVGKDEANLIGEVDKDSLTFPETGKKAFSFKEFLEKAKDNGEDNQ